jgi:PAS domain S-box-containing protein
MFITDPIRKMTDVANNVAKGNLNVIIDTSAKDETGMLAKSFANIVNIVNLLITDLKDLSKRVNAYGNLNVKLNETYFNGAYGEVVENINSFVDAALLAQESAMLTVSAMFESNPHINILFDDAFNVIDCNPEAIVFLGFQSKKEFLDGFFDIISRTLPSVFSDEQHPQGLSQRLKTAAAEGNVKFETELNFNGIIRRLSVDFRKIPYKGSFAIVGYIYDMTEIFQREMQLTRAGELIEMQITKLNLIVKASKVGLWEMEIIHEDPVNSLNTFVWSDELRHMLGYKDEHDLPNMLSSWINMLHPEDKETALDAFTKHILDKTGKTSYDVEYRLLRKTGEYVYYRDFGESIRDNKGNVLRVVGALMDITDTKNMLKEREQQKEAAEAANRAKSTFLATMSHELRTPLNVIIGLTGIMLEDDHMDEHITKNLVKINNGGTTLLSIVNDILDFSKVESGKLILSPVEYHTASLLNDIITITVTRLGEKPIKFYLNISNDLPKKLFGDDLRVKQVLTNLLTNAVKYTNEGSIVLSVNCTREGDTVWLNADVSDTGKGISEEDIDKLFFAYHQVDSQSNRHIEGTGLGLTITKKLVELMDGEINVKSEYGKGSTFSFRVKQSYVDDSVLGADVSDKLRNFCYADDKRSNIKKLARIDLSYARVLVVDDMDTNLDVASGILKMYKMEVDCLTNGPAAIERIRKGTPVYNAIFMDQMMPGMDGIATTDRIRTLDTKYAQKIPIIALTANAIRGTEKIFYEHDFQAFITKPIDVIEMDAVIKKWVRDKNREEVLIQNEHSAVDIQIENMVIEIPGVDTEKGLSLVAGAKKIYLPMLRSYASNTPKVLDKLRSVSAENLHDYVITVHGLKSTSAGIGAEAIREAALKLESMSRSGDLQGVLAKNDKLIAETEIIVANIKAWLEKNDVHEVKLRKKAPDKELLARLRESCESYNMDDIEKAMSELESADYDEGADLVTWIREKIDISKMGDVAKRLKEL